MMRWVMLTVVVVAVAAGGTIALQYLPDTAASPIPASRASEVKGPAPVLTVEEDKTFDFGKMPVQTERTKIWKLKNTGAGPLELTLLETSCTCTNVRFGADGVKLKANDTVEIAPGEEKELYYTWNPKDRRGDFSSNARFATNDLDKNPTVSLGVKGMVLPSVVVLPNELDLREFSNESPIKMSILVFSPTKSDMKIVETPTASRGDFITAEILPLTDEQKKELESMPEASGAQSGFQIAVEIKPGLPIGRFRDALVIKTDHPSMPRVDLPIGGRAVGPISAVPATVFMPGVNARDGGSQEVKLHVRGQESTHFEPVLPASLEGIVEVKIDRADAPGESGQSEAGIPTHTYKMTISIPPGVKSGQKDGVIVLKTDHPNATEIRVPLQVFVRSS